MKGAAGTAGGEVVGVCRPDGTYGGVWADAYLEVLCQHEEIVKGKLAEAERLHTLALNPCGTVSIASGLLDQVNANQTAFDAMLELTLPSIAAYDDAGMQEEFGAITRKLQGGAE